MRCRLPLLCAAALLASAAVVLSAGRTRAQDQGDDGEESGQPESISDLAKDFSDPLTTLPQLFLQDAYTPKNYGSAAHANRLTFRAIIPRIPHFSLVPVQLVRPSFFLVTVPNGKGSSTRTELGDMQLFDAFVLPWPPHESGLRIGIGPTFTFPTATDKLAGQEAWQVGPLFATLYKGIPWLLAGCLLQNPISFAYTSPEAQPLSTLFVQPVVLVALGGGWYVKSADSTWAISWRHGTSTVIPVSFGIGRVIVREDMPPVNFFVTGEWTAYRQIAPVTAQTTVRFGMTMALPQYRLW